MTHLHLTGLPVDLRIVLFQPGVPKDKGLTPQASDCESGVFRVILKAQDGIDDLRDRSHLVLRAIDIEHRNRADQLTCVEAIFLNISSIDELTGGTIIHQSRSGKHLCSVHGFQFQRHSEAQ